MSDLTERERELVAIGAAIASNCVPCIEYHIPEARKAGLSDPQIEQAVRLADKVQRVPAREVQRSAMARLDEITPAQKDASDGPCGCDRSTDRVEGDSARTAEVSPARALQPRVQPLGHRRKETTS
jgi:4-carboxymuconolactone decarboxylase